MNIPDPDLDFFTHPGSRGQKVIGSRILNTGKKECCPKREKNKRTSRYLALANV
jgi:hypothetical protein